MKISRSLGAAGAALCVMAGCGEPTATALGQERAAFGVNGADKLAVYNSGIDRAVGESPCKHDVNRQFDFWVGHWRMGTQRSVVRSLLDGCMIEENYMPGPNPGSPAGADPVAWGRSINTYDRDTGRWHQTWVSLNALGNIRMSGNLADGIMKMVTPNGQISYQWEAVNDSQVVQSWSVFGRPGSLLYTRLHTDVPLYPSAVAPLCNPGTPIPNGARLRELDDLIGTWSVSNEQDVVLGQATFASDMGGCLLRQDYTTDKGYAAHSFLYFDGNTNAFHRTYIDSQGERAELLLGQHSNGVLVLRAAELAPGSRVAQVRNTFRRIDASTMIETWETSEDAVNWTTDMTLTFRRL